MLSPFPTLAAELVAILPQFAAIAQQLPAVLAELAMVTADLAPPVVSHPRMDRLGPGLAGERGGRD